MHTKGPKEDPLVELGYEHRDINIPALRNAVLGFFAFTFFSFGLGWALYTHWDPQFSDEYKNAKENRIIPRDPNPLLQNNITARTDLMGLRQHETAILTSTGWDETHTNLHIPVDQAMSLIAQRGLPPTGNSVPAISKGNTTDQRKDAVPEQQPPAAEGGPKPAAPTGTAAPTTTTPRVAGSKATVPGAGKPLDQQ
jgi:hypothetical protein